MTQECAFLGVARLTFNIKPLFIPQIWP